jgi:hypothetical protein
MKGNEAGFNGTSAVHFVPAAFSGAGVPRPRRVSGKQRRTAPVGAERHLDDGKTRRGF